jgi:two-component system sensor histidine kinase PhoQ
MFTVSWETRAGARRYGYRVAENLATVDTQIRRFRGNLWGWLGGAAALLLVVQTLILRWSLAPLRQVANDLRAIESGLAQRLRGDYPRELRQLTDNLNALLESAESHLGRYRDSLGNLAHSLKTPLAVLRGALEGASDDAGLRRVAHEQLDTMKQLVDYQLQRAAASGRVSLATPVAVRPVVDKVIAALDKVYVEKGIGATVDIDPAIVFHGDTGDLTEMLGNLLDNAYKWGRHRVRVRATRLEGSAPGLELVVDDDGPGIPEDLRARVLERGGRGDRQVPGHGLGLAMVADTVALYRGTLRIENKPGGGLAVTARFPQVTA